MQHTGQSVPEHISKSGGHSAQYFTLRAVPLSLTGKPNPSQIPLGQNIFTVGLIVFSCLFRSSSIHFWTDDMSTILSKPNNFQWNVDVTLFNFMRLHYKHRQISRPKHLFSCLTVKRKEKIYININTYLHTPHFLGLYLLLFFCLLLCWFRPVMDK